MGSSVFVHILGAALVCSVIYGLGVSTLIVSLNSRTIGGSLCSVVTLSIYCMLVYSCVLFLPLFIAGQTVHLLTVFDKLLILRLMLGVSLIGLAITLFAHIKFYKMIWPVFQLNVTKLYAFVTIGIALAVLGWRANDRIGFIVIMVCITLFTSIAALVASLLKERHNAKKGGQVDVKTDDRLEKFDPAGRKVVWIAVDGATLDIINPMIDNGRLPNIASTIKKGAHGRLKTFVPTHSPVIWTTKATGKSPLKHRIRDFMLWKIKGIKAELEIKTIDPLLVKILSKAARYGLVHRRPVSTLDRKSLAIWDIASAAGYKVGVISWFVTNPVEKINGIMVPEFFCTIDSKLSNVSSSIHPLTAEDEIVKIKSKIEERFEGEKGDDEVRKKFCISGSLTDAEKLQFHILKVFYSHDVLRLAITRHVLKLLDLDMLMVCFQGADAVGHNFWAEHGREGSKFKDVIARYYEYIDEIIGILSKEISEPKTVFITSDHGMGSIGWCKKLYNIIVGRNRLSGGHHGGPDGIFVAAGDGIREGVILKDAFVYDITPTILRILELPVGSDMDGRPVSEIFEESVSSVKYIRSYENRIAVELGASADLVEHEEVLDKLRALGYIE